MLASRTLAQFFFCVKLEWSEQLSAGQILKYPTKRFARSVSKVEGYTFFRYICGSHDRGHYDRLSCRIFARSSCFASPADSDLPGWFSHIGERALHRSGPTAPVVRSTRTRPLDASAGQQKWRLPRHPAATDTFDCHSDDPSRRAIHSHRVAAVGNE